MTIYRRRLSSSVYALRTTLERHYAAVKNGGPLQLEALDEDIPDDETMDEILDAEEAQALEREGLGAKPRHRAHRQPALPERGRVGGRPVG